MSQLLKRRFFEQIKVMVGAEPGKPTEIAPAAQAIHFHKKGNRDLIAECFHEGDCRKVCLVPHVLDTVIKGRAVETEVPLGPDCTAAACASTPARPGR